MTKDLAARLKSKATLAQLKKETPAVAPKAPSAVERREALKKAIADLDEKQIDRTRYILTRYVDSMVTLDPEQTKELTPAQRKALMEEDLQRREIDDLLTARKETIKELVFQAITEEAAAAGAEDPEYTNGEILVEELGHRFTREGASLGTASFDIKKLKAVLAEEVGDECLDLYVTTEWEPKDVLNEEAINDLLSGNPELIEKVRETMVLGKPKKGSFYNRKVK